MGPIDKTAWYKTQKVITCFLPKGKSKAILELLKEKKVTRANFAFARGFDITSEETKKGVPEQREQEILTVIAEADEAEELFDSIFLNSEINTPGGGIMYMGPLNSAVPFFLPEGVEEEESHSKQRPVDLNL